MKLKNSTYITTVLPHPPMAVSMLLFLEKTHSDLIQLQLLKVVTHALQPPRRETGVRAALGGARAARQSAHRNPYEGAQLWKMAVLSHDHCGFGGKVLCLTEVVGLVVVGLIVVGLVVVVAVVSTSI